MKECPACSNAYDGECYPHQVQRLDARVDELETALRDLLRYTDEEFAGDNMPDSPEQAAARAMVATSTEQEK